LVPLTVKEKASAPVVALVCEMEVIAGAGGDEVEIVKGSVLVRTPKFDTSIFTGTVEGEAISKGGMAAMSCVELTKVVASGVIAGGVPGTIHSTTDPFTKFAPFTVSVTPGGLHAGVVALEFVEDDNEAIVGALIVKAASEEAAVPGLIRSRFVLPGFARSAAGTVAISSGLPGETAGT
jgi:hypothetical protein